MSLEPGHVSATAGPSPAPAYWTPEQVASLLQLSVKSVYRIAGADETMPALRLPGRGASLRFPREALERWLRSRTQGRPPIHNRLHSAPKPAPQQAADGA